MHTREDELRGYTKVALIPGEVYRVKFFYRWENIEALMVANWRLDATDPQATETQLAEAFMSNFEVSATAKVRSDQSILYKVEVQETFGGLDYGVAEGTVPGQVAGDNAPSFVALAIRQNVGTRLVRPGQKRIPFISDEIGTGNEPSITSGTKADLEEYFGEAVRLIYTDVEGVEWQFDIHPMIVGVTWNPNATPPQYVLDPTKQVPVTSAQVTRITSQNSRKT